MLVKSEEVTAASLASHQESGVPAVRNPYDVEYKDSATFQLFRNDFDYAQVDGTQEPFERLVSKYGASSTWVYTAVSRTGDAVKQIPCQIIKKQLEGKPGAQVTGYDFGLRDLIDAPNPYQSWADLMELCSICLDLTGNAYVEKVLGPAERTLELYVLNPARVTILPQARGYIKAFVYTVNGRDLLLPRENIVHIKLPHPLNDYYGLSPLTAARLAIDMDRDALEWNRTFMRKGGWPGGAISTDADLDKPTIQRLKREIKETLSTGKERAGHIMLLTSGLTYTPIAVSPKEMDWLDARRYSRDEILAIFNVPFAIAGLFSTEQTTARSAGVEQQIKQFYRGKVCSVVKRILDALNREVVPAFSRNYKLVADLRSVPALADDVAVELARAQAATALIDAGFSINQVMARFYPDMNPVAWGDVMWTGETQVAIAGPFNPTRQNEDGSIIEPVPDPTEQPTDAPTDQPPPKKGLAAMAKRLRAIRLRSN